MLTSKYVEFNRRKLTVRDKFPENSILVGELNKVALWMKDTRPESFIPMEWEAKKPYPDTCLPGGNKPEHYLKNPTLPPSLTRSNNYKRTGGNTHVWF